MPLLSIDNLSIAFGAEKLLDGASFQIDPGERVCLIGRNGTGKTTLLRLLAGEVQADGGETWRQPGLRVATLAQELPMDTTATVFEIVAGGLEGLGELLAEYHEAAHQLADASTPENLRRMEQLQHELEARDGWRWQQRVEIVISRLQLPADTPLAELSGGAVAARGGQAQSERGGRRAFGRSRHRLRAAVGSGQNGRCGEAGAEYLVDSPQRCNSPRRKNMGSVVCCGWRRPATFR